jgi:sporulation protein YlmC with PRC-barrel domain
MGILTNRHAEVRNIRGTARTELARTAFRVHGDLAIRPGASTKMERNMKGYRSMVAVSLVAIGVAGPAMAQMFYMTTDRNMRSSKLIGMTVYNDHNEKIGVIDDIMLPAAGGEVTAVLSVGGFLGIGEKLIKVPLSHVHFRNNNAMMDGGDKASMGAMPKYSYGFGGGGG